jgi:hypothetical protein
MKEIKPPMITKSEGPTIFLAGSIEMGSVEDWQATVVKRFENYQITFFNPRRDEWDSSWKQEQKETKFNEQVNWEMNNLEDCDIIFLYFHPETKAPISLLELGLHAANGKMIVVCPDGFWRKGNVEIVCTRYNIPLFNTLEDGMGSLESKIRHSRLLKLLPES